MEKLSGSVFVLLLLLFGCATHKPSALKSQAAEQQVNQVVNFSDQSTWLLGYIVPGQLTREPHKSWYIKGYNEFVPDTIAINKLMSQDKSALTIKIVLGTWCPDSRREVPRFMRILDLWAFPDSKVTFIGVDDAKLSPIGEYENLDIQRVPTFIIYKNNIEAGRIIENPVTSLEQDIVNILSKSEQ